MRKTQSALSLLGVAAVGAAAMYLLDPKTGEERRRRLGERASGALAGAEGALGEGWETLSAKASELAARAAKFGSDAVNSASDCMADFKARASDNAGEAAGGVGDYAARVAREASEYAHRLSEQAKAAGSDWTGQAQSVFSGLGSKFIERLRGASDSAHSGADQVSNQAQSLAEEARDWARRAQAASGRLLHRAGDAVGGVEENEGLGIIAPIALTAVTCCVVGFGVMYFFVDERGTERREFVLEKSTDVMRQTGELFRRIGRHLRQRIVGMTSGEEDGSFTDPANVGLAGTSAGTADQYPQMQK